MDELLVVPEEAAMTEVDSARQLSPLLVGDVMDDGAHRPAPHEQPAGADGADREAGHLRLVPHDLARGQGDDAEPPLQPALCGGVAGRRDALGGQGSPLALRGYDGIDKLLGTFDA